MYTLIKISCHKHQSKSYRTFNCVIDAIEFINTYQIKIIQVIYDAAGNVTGFLCKDTPKDL